MARHDNSEYSWIRGKSNQTAKKLYEVVTGDSLLEIARREYGDAQLWRQIYDANRNMIRDPDKIYPGQKLWIPKEL